MRRAEGGHGPRKEAHSLQNEAQQWSQARAEVQKISHTPRKRAIKRGYSLHAGRSRKSSCVCGLQMQDSVKVPLQPISVKLGIDVAEMRKSSQRLRPMEEFHKGGRVTFHVI